MKRIITILTSAMLALGSWAQDIPAVLRTIEQGNAQLRAAREAGKATIADLEAENTRLGATSLEYSPFFHRGIKGLASSELILSQEFDYPTLYAHRRRGIELQQDVCDLQYLTLRRNILLEASQLCYDLVLARKSALLIDQRIAATDSLLALYTRRLDLGHATIMELNRIKLDRMNLDTEASVCQGEASIILERLTSMNGGEPISALATFDHETLASLLPPSSMMLPGADPDGILSTTQDLSPTSDHAADLPLEVAAAEAALAASRHEVMMSRKAWYPTFTLGFRRNTELHEANGGFLVGVAFSLSGNGKKRQAAQLHRSAAELELGQAQRDAESRTQRLHTEIATLQRTLSTYDVPLMQQSLSTLLRAVVAGEISITDYYTEAERIYSILQQRLTTENAYYKALVELQRDTL